MSAGAVARPATATVCSSRPFLHSLFNCKIEETTEHRKDWNTGKRKKKNIIKGRMEQTDSKEQQQITDNGRSTDQWGTIPKNRRNRGEEDRENTARTEIDEQKGRVQKRDSSPEEMQIKEHKRREQESARMKSRQPKRTRSVHDQSEEEDALCTQANKPEQKAAV